LAALALAGLTGCGDAGVVPTDDGADTPADADHSEGLDTSEDPDGTELPDIRPDSDASLDHDAWPDHDAWLDLDAWLDPDHAPDAWLDPDAALDPDSDASLDIDADASLDPDADSDPLAACYLATPPAPEPEALAFVDVSHRADAVPVATSLRGVTDGGVAVADLTGDGWPDIVVATSGGGLRFLRSTPAALLFPRFVDDTAASGLGAAALPTALAYADVDGDGDHDLFVGAVGASYLFLNDGAGRFTDASATWLPPFPAFESRDRVAVGASAVFGDFDGDGDLDIFQAIWARLDPADLVAPADRLLRNEGDHFVALPAAPSDAERAAPTLAAAWHDFDADGLLDLFVVRDYGPWFRPNSLYRGLGASEDGTTWRFDDVGPSLGLDAALFGMSATLGDVDNDGILDAYVANLAHNPLYFLGTSPLTATEAPAAWGGAAAYDPAPCPAPTGPSPWPDFSSGAPGSARALFGAFCERYCEPAPDAWPLTSWGSVFFDADHDGRLDLFVANGHVGFRPTIPEAEAQPNLLYRNTGEALVLSDETAFPRLRGDSRGAAVADLDRDGDLDLVWVDNGAFGPGAVRILENRLAAGHWLTLSVTDDSTPANRDAVGALVRLRAGGLEQVRLVDGGQGYASASERIAHFGLGDAEVLEHLSVQWPDGDVTVVPTAGFAVDRHVRIER
jgi:hypothetical protein